ncbi:MAG: hypothetical protein A3F18_01840 [Legionellales bacterium RIFCSPHIGHO2_12_FULL_37_14]|nr:MAG: hypothetical protein A3F18_01840 [Legionellales bacterium RIFCSPHIGHO2_12_FULL_37_14]
MLSVNETLAWIKENFILEWVWIALSGLFSLFFLINLIIFINFEINVYPTVPSAKPVNLPKQITTGSWLQTPIFGMYVPHLNDKDISVSALSYVIVGILYSKKNKDSQVIIRNDDGFEKIYFEGAELRAGITVKHIRPREIIILNHGRIEKLNLPKTALHFEPAQKPLSMKEL